MEQAQQQPVSQETPAIPAEPKTEQISPQFAALAKKEKALRMQFEEIKREKEAMKAKEQEYEQKYIPKDRLTKDPMSVMKENGITYDQLTSLMLNQPGPTDMKVQELQDKIMQLEEKISQQAKSAEDKQSKAYENAVNQIRNEAKILIDSDPAFEVIKSTDNVESVVALIEETHKKTGVILSVQDAANKVEEHLIGEALKYAKLGKVQAKLTPATAEPQKPQSQGQSQLKTLTNAVSASSANKPLSSKDRRARAIAAFQGTLK